MSNGKLINIVFGEKLFSVIIYDLNELVVIEHTIYEIIFRVPSKFYLSRYFWFHKNFKIYNAQ